MTDVEILSLIRSESELDRGFRALMVKYQEKIYWTIRKIVGTHEDADDVIQNTFLKVFKNIASFEERSSLYTWIYRIAINESITHQKTKKFNPHTSASDFQLEIGAKPTTDFDEVKAQSNLLKAIDTLPEKQKEVFSLRYFDEMSYHEMSEKLQTSVGALKASYHHAVKKIESYILSNMLT